MTCLRNRYYIPANYITMHIPATDNTALKFNERNFVFSKKLLAWIILTSCNYLWEKSLLGTESRA